MGAWGLSQVWDELPTQVGKVGVLNLHNIYILFKHLCALGAFWGAGNVLYLGQVGH